MILTLSSGAVAYITYKACTETWKYVSKLSDKKKKK